MSKIRLIVGEYLQTRGLTPAQLVEAIGTAANPEIIHELAKKGNNQEQIDLSVLAAIVQGLRKLMGFPVGIEEILQFMPDITAEKINPATNAWYERDIYGEIPPYDWGEVDPLEGTKPVRYIPGVGIVIENIEEKVKQSGDATT